MLALMVLTTGIWHSPMVVVGYDPCSNAMVEKELNKENLLEFENCLKKNNYFREAGK